METLNIEAIKQFVNSRKIRWTNHILIRLLQKNINQVDVEQALLNGEIKGKKVKELLEEIIQNNDNGVNELGKFVSVHTKNISSYKGNVEDVCEQANYFEDGENTTKNIENAKKEIKNLIEKIEEEKLYTVKTSTEQGAVYAVEISEK